MYLIMKEFALHTGFEGRGTFFQRGYERAHQIGIEADGWLVLGRPPHLAFSSLMRVCRGRGASMI